MANSGARPWGKAATSRKMEEGRRERVAGEPCGKIREGGPSTRYRGDQGAQGRPVRMSSCQIGASGKGGEAVRR